MEPINNTSRMDSSITNMSPPPSKKRLSFSLNPKTLIILLLVIIGVMLFLWKPWDSSPKATDRTVSVTGEATIKAEPDEFVFYPQYEFKNADKAAALAAMIKKSEEIVGALKKIGVADSKIKTNVDDYNRGYYFPETEGSTTTYSLRLDVTVTDKDQAQKVQDYIVSTAPSGAVTPQSTFSDTKRKELESQAREEASKDARSKADQSAKNLGFKVGQVKTISEGSGFGDIYPMLNEGAVDAASLGVSAPKLSIQAGEDELSYSVTVIYYIK